MKKLKDINIKELEARYEDCKAEATSCTQQIQELLKKKEQYEKETEDLVKQIPNYVAQYKLEFAEKEVDETKIIYEYQTLQKEYKDGMDNIRNKRWEEEQVVRRNREKECKELYTDKISDIEAIQRSLLGESDKLTHTISFLKEIQGNLQK